MKRKAISSKNGPAPLGPYSQAVKVGDFIFVSGQNGMVSLGKVSGTIEDEARQALENVKRILEGGGSSLGEVVKTTVFLTDINDFAKMNAVYSQYFTECPPARTTVEVSRIPGGGKIEIDAVAMSRRA